MRIAASLIVCILFMSFTFSGMAQSKTDSPPPVTSATEAREQIAAEFLANMVRHDYDNARKDFSKTMDDGISAEKLKNKWLEIGSKIGNFQKVEYTKEEKVNDNYQVKKRCQFTDQNLSVILTFNEENHS
jgi:hypothetical protein